MAMVGIEEGAKDNGFSNNIINKLKVCYSYY